MTLCMDITMSFWHFYLCKVLDLDEKNQVLKTYVYYRLYWNDEFLTWDPSEYNNITSSKILNVSLLY